MNRRVDVIVPSYNYAAYLETCVKSLVDQPGVDVRVLVIDDASTDETAEIGPRLAIADRRVTYRRHDVNRGHIATYNEGFQWASGDYLLLISADDLLAPGALERAVTLLERHPGAVFAWGRQVLFSDSPRLPDDAATLDGYSVTPGLEFISSLCAIAQNPVATPTVVVRTDAQHRVGGYDPRLPHTADLETWLKLAACGDVIEINAYQAFKRQHGRNMQLAFLTNPDGDIVERREAFEAFFAHAGAQVPDAGTHMGHALKAMATELFWRAAELFEAGHSEKSAALLASASTMYPAITMMPEWRRMTVKRALGARVWSVVQSVAGRRAG